MRRLLNWPLSRLWLLTLRLGLWSRLRLLLLLRNEHRLQPGHFGLLHWHGSGLLRLLNEDGNITDDGSLRQLLDGLHIAVTASWSALSDHHPRLRELASRSPKRHLRNLGNLGPGRNLGGENQLGGSCLGSLLLELARNR